MMPNSQVTEKKQGKVGFYIYINKSWKDLMWKNAYTNVLERTLKNNKYCVLKRKI